MKPLVYLQFCYKLKKQMFFRFGKVGMLLTKKLWYDSKLEVMTALSVGNRVVYKLGDNSMLEGVVKSLGDFSVFINEQQICVTKICLITK